jgi:hypothetical protein
MTGEPVDQIVGVAGILAATDPGAWRKLLSEHVADSSGHCRSCPTSSGASPVWPCGLRMIGEVAERMAAQHARRSAGRNRLVG